MADKSTEMTREDLQAMFEEIIGRKLSDIEDERKAIAEQRIKELVLLEHRHNAKFGELGDPDGQRPYKEPGMAAGRFLRAMAAGKGNAGRAADWCRSELEDEFMAKALGESTLAGGGAMVPEEFASDVIEYLRARAVIRGLGPIEGPLPGGSLTMAYVSQGSTAAYVGENTNYNATELTFGALKLQARKIAAIVAISNDLLRHTGRAGDMRADQIVRDDLVRAFAAREDLAFIRGNGAQDTPLGMLYWCDATHKFAAANTAGTADGSTIAEKTSDLGRCVRQLEEANVAVAKGAFVMAPRSKWDLMTDRDGNNNLVWGEEMARGTLMGFPFRSSSQIPTNLDISDGDHSEVYFADFDSLMIGDDLMIQIDTFDGAAYVDSSGTLVSAVTQDQTVMRALSAHDFGSRYRGLDISVIEEVRWGAEA